MNRTELLTRLQSMHDLAASESRAFNETETAEWARLLGEVRRIDELPDSRALRPIGGRRTLGDAAANLCAEMRDAASSRAMVEVALRDLSSNAGTGALGTTQYATTPNNLGPFSMYAAPARLLDFIGTVPVTQGNSVFYVRVSYATGSPQGNAAAAVAELALKPESELQTQDVTQPLRTWAHWLKASRQILDDVPGLRAMLDGLLTGGLLDIVDAGIFSTMSGTSLMAGANYTSFTPVADESIFDACARAAAAVAQAGGRNVVVALNPGDFLTASLAKADTAGTYLGQPPGVAARIVSVPSVTSGKLLAWGSNAVSWADRQAVSVVLGYADDDLIRNAVRLLAECRGDMMIVNPNQIFYGDNT